MKAPEPQNHSQSAPDLPRTFNERFEEIARRFPNRTAFRMKTPAGYSTVSYAEAYRQARAVAWGLTGLGLKSGDRVAVLSENRPEWVVAYLGIYLSGMVAVPLDAQISPLEWRGLLDDAEAQTVFVSGSLLRDLERATADSIPPRRLISFDSAPGEHDARSDLENLIDRALRLPNPPTLPEVRPSDVVTIIYTSGTTGTPKGVMLTQSNIVGEIHCILQAIHADENDALLCLLPLQHVLASVINVLVPLYLGAQVVFADTLKRSEIMQALQEAGITILATVPQFFYLFHNRIHQELAHRGKAARAFFRGLLRLNRCSMRLARLNLGKVFFPGVHRSFGSSLRLFVSGGSAFDPAVAQDFHDMGFTILQGYGLTETTGACTVTRVENNVIGSVGPALPGADVRILSPDENGNGEVLIRGPMVMKGYYKNPSATAESIRDGWFHSGDLGRLDARGNLFITGRKKEVIVLPNGKNIYPDELEAHYLQSPCIQEIAVLGIYSPQERGERLHGVVVPNFEYLKSRKVANTREILRDEIAALSHRLPQYKRLMSYQVQSEPLPRTTTRKIKRLELKRLIESGGLKSSETEPPAESPRAEDQVLMESVVAQEVLACLRETYHRDMPIRPDTNLELDLGFDSMEKVELLASLEHALNLQLPEDFGADILTVRDLVVRLEQQAGAVSQSGTAARQSWKAILSEESADREETVDFRLSGTALTLAKFALLRFADFLFFRPLLRLEVAGLENLPSRGTYLICPNHESYLDPFVLAARLPYRVFRRLFFVGYSVFFDHWLMKIFARCANIIPVDPDAHLLQAMKAGARGLRAGYILCIFPEGGRSFDGRLQAFKKGAAILSRELSLPIVPVGIEGAHEAWPRDSLRIRPHKVTVRFGEPLLPSSGDGPDPYRQDTERLRAAVARLTQNS